MKKAILTILLLFGAGIAASVLLSQQQDYQSIMKSAEQFYKEGSFARAHEMYVRLSELDLPVEEKKWVEFRIADTVWRSEAATGSADTTKMDDARKKLEAIITSEKEDAGLRAEAQESLGDFYWMQPNSHNWGSAWPYYQSALEWWAGSDDIENARNRYLAIVKKLAEPAQPEPYYYYGYYGNQIPLNVLENALKIAVSSADKAQMHYLIAMSLMHQNAQQYRVIREFEEAIQFGKSAGWHDDALYHYGEWLMRSPIKTVQRKNGSTQTTGDFPKALSMFRTLIEQYSKGETRYYDQAKNQISDITNPALSVSVSNIFVPNSEIQYHLNWRNIKTIELSLYRIDLTRDVLLKEGSGNWLTSIQTGSGQRIKSWNKDAGDRGDHVREQESLFLENKLEPGAYIIEAKSGSQNSRDLILVTDTSLVIKTSGRKALLYFCDANNGSPIANAQASVWIKFYSDSNWQWRELKGTTGNDGLLVLDLPVGTSSNEIFAAAVRDSRQAFTTAYSYYAAQQNEWKIYAFTDRPAYRPDEEVKWKLIARRYDGSVYTNPSGQKIRYEITDPRGTKVAENTSTLNAFGSAWGSLHLTGSMPLGEYRITIQDGGGRSIGYATLFRLEEYKLPEFKVSIQTPKENGKAKTFRPGQTIEVSIEAEYYFGGGVPNASAEVLVYQSPYYHWWIEPREYPWFYQESSRYQNWYGQGQIVQRETIKTDSNGKALIKIDTPYGSQQDLQYRIEARITDASRREITASGTVNVTRQPYFVHPKVEHYLYRPQDEISASFKAVDSNNQPVSREGEIQVTRDFWFEVWISPDGKEYKGKELEEVRSRYGIFPPVPSSQDHQWKLKFRGYQHDEILTTKVKTNENGDADLSFKAEKEGYYRIAWKSEDATEGLMPVSINAETAVWVATNSTTELGYRHGGLQIIVDKDTFKAGQTAPVMLHTPASNRYVLFTIEAGDLYSYQLVHMDGTVKLLEIPIDEKHVPNVFLGAAMVNERQIYQDTKEVVVPPVKNFLQVKIEPDRKQYQPREDGTLLITTLDHEGKPVPAEIALASVDESVYYIQEEYAGDPRQFFFGDKRVQRVQLASTFQMKSYLTLKDQERMNELNRQEKYSMSDVAGGTASDFQNDGLAMAAEPVAAPSPPPPVPQPAAKAGRMKDSSEDDAAKQPEDAVVEVRSDFRSTIFWQPDLVTGKDGRATVKFKYPDSLTTWKAVARAAGVSNQFGIAEAETQTNKPLIVRLQAPRFFVAGDTVTISAIVNNNTAAPANVTTTLAAQGLEPSDGTIQPVQTAINAQGEARAEWSMKATRSGTAELKVTSRSADHSDAMQKSYPVLEHGIEKFIGKSGKVRGNEVQIMLNIPAERKKESTQFNVQVTPSMAVTMLDSLPYLLDYPYGCTEQTMSRFLPAAIIGKTLHDLGIKSVSGNYGGIVEEHLAKTHPEGKRDIRKLDEIVKRGLDRLYDFQHSDGGWGWWKEGESDHYMSAYVVWGLTLAQTAGIEIKNDVLERGANFLRDEIVEQEANHDQQAWMLHALSAYRMHSRTNISDPEKKALENLWQARNRMNAYTRALLALSAHQYGDREKAEVLARNLENGAQVDRRPDNSILIKGSDSPDESLMATVHWGEEKRWWRWSEGAVESTAFVLRALLAIDPENKLIEPATNWLIKNRRGAQWSNTRDTAITLLTLTDYLKTSGELKTDLEYQLSVNGKMIATKKVNAENILSAPSTFSIDSDLIQDGANEIRIQKLSGNGPLYFAAHSQFFSLEEPLTAAGNEIFVKREYYRLAGKPTLLKGYVYDRVKLQDGDVIKSGDRIEVVITAEAKNDYEYLVFEDLKAAGLEAVQIRSGEAMYAQELKSGTLQAKIKETDSGKSERIDFTGRSRWVYQELRDRKVAMFIDKLPQGYWEMRYTLRAETPGKFHSLPLMTHAMYVPEIRANSDETRIVVNSAE